MKTGTLHMNGIALSSDICVAVSYKHESSAKYLKKCTI